MIDPVGYCDKHVLVTGAFWGSAKPGPLLVELRAEMTALDTHDTAVPVSRRLQVHFRDRSAIEQAAASPPQIDALFDSAGVPGAPFSGGTAPPPVEIMLVNFTGPRYLIELTVPSMRPGSAT